MRIIGKVNSKVIDMENTPKKTFQQEIEEMLKGIEFPTDEEVHADTVAWNRAVANKLKAKDPEWRAAVNKMLKLRAQDPTWQQKHFNILQELALKAKDPKWITNRVESIKNFWNSEEGKLIKDLRNNKVSSFQQEFWNSEEGQLAREKKSQSRKTYYQTEKGQLQLQKYSTERKGIPKPKVICPHCDKEGGIPVMKRYHFDNCKSKPILDK